MRISISYRLLAPSTARACTAERCRSGAAASRRRLIVELPTRLFGSRQDDLLDGVREALVRVRGGHERGPVLDLVARIAHRDAEPGALEHQHVVRLIADRDDAIERDLDVTRQALDDHALVRRRTGHVEVVWLRARGRDLGAVRLLDRGLAGGDARMVLAHPDDLDDALHHAVEA